MILSLGMVALGLVLLVGAGDILVRGATGLAFRLGIPPLIVGLTVVAFGTSAPELMVSVAAVLDNAPGIALGNVIGSNIANVLLVLGLPAIIATVRTHPRETRQSYLIMIAASLLFIVLCFLGPIRVPHALALLAALGLMIWGQIRDALSHRAQGNESEAIEAEEEDPNLSRGKIALILALGLLVDDAIIAVEMMAIKMEQGYSRLQAAGHAWRTTAFPMLTGTLITAAGFLPIATAASSTGEYTRSIFQVVTIALIVSWFAAVLFVPYLGDKLLPDFNKELIQKAPWYSRLWARLRKQPEPQPMVHHAGEHHDPYQTKFYQGFRRWVDLCVTYRKTVIATTVAIFVLSVLMFKLVPQQFFPPSNRAEILVDLKLEEGASLTATENAVKKVEQFLSKQEGIDNYVAYVGTGSPRFYLPLDQQLPQASFAQFVVLASSLDDRNEIRKSLDTQIRQLLPDVRTRVSLLENGPPVGYPLQYRVSGEDLTQVRAWADKVAAMLSANPNTTNVHLDWGEPSKMINLEIDQDRARQMGVSSLDLANFLNSSISGATINQYREKRELIEIRLRGDQAERVEVASLASLAVPTSNGGTVPLAQIAKIDYSFEEGLIWHRNRLPTITVRADIRTKLQPATVVDEMAEQMNQLRAELPNGYLVEVGGTVEESARGGKSVAAGMPLFLAVVMTLLMIQLRSMSRATIVLLTAPLGLIGVVLFLLLFNKPFGFVAMLGTIALSGMIMRNSLILIDQIEQDIQAGHESWDAIIDATVRRCRPIVLTALAAVLAMIPLSRSIFFGPMAVAIMGGLIVATLLTLFFLPALYAQWFKVKKISHKP